MNMKIVWLILETVGFWASLIALYFNHIDYGALMLAFTVYFKVRRLEIEVSE